MSSFYRLLAAYAPLIYIGLVIWGLFVARSMFRTWQEWRDSVYSLEREFALRRLVRATVFGLLILGFLFAEFFVATFIVPSLPASDILSTPTLDLLAAPVSALTPGSAGTLSPESQSPPTGMSGCVADQVMITAPKPGELLSGLVTLTGTADIPNFGFYKYEISSLGSNAWATVSAGDKPVRNEKLGEWDTTTLANGDYFLQLVLIDNAGQTIEPCVIAVRIAN